MSRHQHDCYLLIAVARANLDEMHKSAERIRRTREAMPPGPGARKRGKHLSREELAASVGVATATIQKWETKGYPYADELLALRRATGKSLDYLLGAEDLEETEVALTEGASMPRDPDDPSVQDEMVATGRAFAQRVGANLEQRPEARGRPRKKREAGRQG